MCFCTGWHATDPEGLVFLKKDAAGKWVAPDFADPGLEKWVDPSEDDASGWGREKVIKDIREWGKLENFTTAQKEEWEAVFDFHERFQAPDALPPAPHMLVTATTGRSMQLHGMPISWAEMWSTLRRLPRPHLNASASTSAICQPGPSSTAATTSTATIQKGLALENSVTGSNYPRRARDKDAEIYKTKVHASELPHSLSSVESNTLYFIALPDFEGEMAVGVGRVSKCIMAGEKVASAEVEWLVRRGWSADPTAAGFNWGTSPMFDAYKPDGRVAKNEHPIADFLPVEVELTDGSTHNAHVSLADKRQRFCITSKCVSMLREFCYHVRPELITKKDSEPQAKKKRAK